MKPFFKTVRNVRDEQHILLSRSYGMIEAANGKLVRVQLRPWPKLGSLMEAHWNRGSRSRFQQQNVCRLFYNQPLGHRNFLTLSYIESSRQTTLKTFFATLDVLSQIAFVKRSDAIIAEVTNDRISDRLLVRRGWDLMKEKGIRRTWIKRFYGEFPEDVKAAFDYGLATSQPEPLNVVS